jgi:hypothetical protein
MFWYNNMENIALIFKIILIFTGYGSGKKNFWKRPLPNYKG